MFNAVNDENTVSFLEDQESNFREVKRYIDAIIDGEPIEISDLKYEASRTVHELGWNVGLDKWNKLLKKEVIPSAPQIHIKNNKYLVAACAIFLGSLGFHKFLLRSYTAGVIMLVATIISGADESLSALHFIVQIIAIIEGVIYIIMPSDKFKETYIHNRKPWF